MSYINPATVVSPRNALKLVEILYNGGDDRWSLARIEFDGLESLGIRWNGSDDQPGIGNPQSRGNPTWFVIPDELADVIREEVNKFGGSKHAELLSGYREMATDSEREAEAEEWSEGLIGDASDQER